MSSRHSARATGMKRSASSGNNLQRSRVPASSSKRLADQQAQDQNTDEVFVYWHNENVTPKPLIAPASNVTSGDVKAPTGGDIKREPQPLEIPEDNVTEGLTKKVLDQIHNIRLVETDTFTLFHLPSMIELRDTEPAERVTAANKRYEAFKHKIGVTAMEKYVSHGVETDNPLRKDRIVVTETPATQSANVAATQYDIYATMKSEETTIVEQVKQALHSHTQERLENQLSTPGIFLETDAEIIVQELEQQQQQQQQVNRLPGRGSSPSRTTGASKTAAAAAAGNTQTLRRTPSGRVIEGDDATSAPVKEQEEVIDESELDEGQRADLERKRQQKLEAERKLQEAQRLRDRLTWKGDQNLPIPESLQNAALVMERSLLQTEYHPAHLLYRAFPSVEEMLSIMTDSAAEKQKKKRAAFSHNEKADRIKAEEQRLEEERRVQELKDFRRQRKIALRRALLGEDLRSADPSAEAVSDDEDDDVPEADRAQDWANGEDPPQVRDLLHFSHNEITKGLPVTCLDWSGKATDILAAAYGDANDAEGHQKEGKVLFWSLRNPTYPERVFTASSTVTTLKFSQVHPSILAAGLLDGNVCLWDARAPSARPSLTTAHSPAASGNPNGTAGGAGGGAAGGAGGQTSLAMRHREPVWSLKFVSKAEEAHREFFASVGGDGSVMRWDWRRGLESSLLMQISKTANPNIIQRSLNLAAPSFTTNGPNGMPVPTALPGGKNSPAGTQGGAGGGNAIEGALFRRASLLCVDFQDYQAYVAGTDDGMIHSCNTAYTDAIIDSFCAHAGPVYATQSNPFESDVLLSCSADWTVGLWSLSRKLNVGSFKSMDLASGVSDIHWAPRDACSFASCAEDGRIEIWDLEKRSLDPIAVHFPAAGRLRNADGELVGYSGGYSVPNHKKRTTVRYAPTSPVVASGDVDGGIDIVRLFNCDCPAYSNVEQRDRIREVVNKKLSA